MSDFGDGCLAFLVRWDATRRRGQEPPTPNSKELIYDLQYKPRLSFSPLGSSSPKHDNETSPPSQLIDVQQQDSALTMTMLETTPNKESKTSSIQSEEEIIQMLNILKHPPPDYLCRNGREGRYCCYCFGNFPSTSNVNDDKNAQEEEEDKNNFDLDSSFYKFMDSPTFLTKIDEFERKDRWLRRRTRTSPDVQQSFKKHSNAVQFGKPSVEISPSWSSSNSNRSTFSNHDQTLASSSCSNFHPKKHRIRNGGTQRTNERNVRCSKLDDDDGVMDESFTNIKPTNVNSFDGQSKKISKAKNLQAAFNNTCTISCISSTSTCLKMPEYCKEKLSTPPPSSLTNYEKTMAEFNDDSPFNNSGFLAYLDEITAMNKLTSTSTSNNCQQISLNNSSINGDSTSKAKLLKNQPDDFTTPVSACRRSAVGIGRKDRLITCSRKRLEMEDPPSPDMMRPSEKRRSFEEKNFELLKKVEKKSTIAGHKTLEHYFSQSHSRKSF